MGDISADLKKIPEPRPFKSTFEDSGVIRDMKAIVAGYPMKIFFED